MDPAEMHCPFIAQTTEKSVEDRIVLIGDSLEKESWLPVSFRTLLASELPVLKQLARHRGRIWRQKLARQVLTLAMASWIYAPSPLESETVSQLRTLDLELNAAAHGADDDLGEGLFRFVGNDD